MKKNIVIVILLIATIVTIGLIVPSKQPQQELIRIHIRANSNLSTDQTVKYAVRDSVVAYLTPFLQEATTRLDAYKILQSHLDMVQTTANQTLKNSGYSYTSSVELLEEYFPTRYYEDIEVESGYYDALIVNLGSGEGDNWWCVVYPPLCFVNANGEGKIQYKSKLLELLNK